MESKKESPVPSSVTMFVALYLIILAFFIILTKDLSFDDYKQTVAMHSLEKTFGRPKTRNVLFGRLNEPKIDEFPTMLEALFKDNVNLEISPLNDEVVMTGDKDFFFYPDEDGFKPGTDKLMNELRELLYQWDDAESPKFEVTLSLTDYNLDAKRLDFFRENFTEQKFDVGVIRNGQNHFILRVKK